MTTPTNLQQLKEVSNQPKETAMNNTINYAKEQAQKCYENIKTLLEDQTEEGAEAIYETPLEVLVRSPWYLPFEDASPAEYQILLCTGGPAVRITGRLENGSPVSAKLEYQDWFQPWMEYAPFVADGNLAAELRQIENKLLEFASFFHYGV